MTHVIRKSNQKHIPHVQEGSFDISVTLSNNEITMSTSISLRFATKSGSGNESSYIGWSRIICRVFFVLKHSFPLANKYSYLKLLSARLAKYLVLQPAVFPYNNISCMFGLNSSGSVEATLRYADVRKGQHTSMSVCLSEYSRTASAYLLARL